LKPTTQWTVGTLSYDRRKLIKLFAWLLWGDFIVMLMMSIMPSLLPLSLKSHGASNATIGLLVGTIPAAIGFVFNPIISTASDRHRGKMGRRIPFLLWSTPVITLFLILVGFAPQIGAFCHRSWFDGICDKNSLVLWMIGAFTIGYQISNLFVAAVYWYLLADIIPSVLMGRFLSMMRLVSQFAGFVFGQYVFVHAERHISTIFLAIGVIYMISFMSMCFGVKEGSYPPPESTGEKFNPILWIKDYFCVCFSRPAIVCIFLLTALVNTWGAAIVLFNFFGLNDLRLSYQEVGNINGVSAITAIPAVLIGGWLVDRIGAIKLTFIAAGILTSSAFCAFLYAHSYHSFLLFSILLATGITVFQIGQIPMYITFFPKEKYGQFCSANALVACLFAMGNNYLIGIFIDLMQNQYRYLFLYLGIAWTLMLVPLILIAFFRNMEMSKSDVPIPQKQTIDLNTGSCLSQ